MFIVGKIAMAQEQDVEITRASSYTLEVHLTDGTYLGPTDISWLARTVQVGHENLIIYL